MVVWDRLSGKPIYPAIIWQDRRTSNLCNELKNKENLESEIRKKQELYLESNVIRTSDIFTSNIR